MSYLDLQEHLSNLESAGLLPRIRHLINKDTEIHLLVCWQFRGGLPESDRNAFLFENVVDSHGRTYDIPAAVATLASRRVKPG